MPVYDKAIAAEFSHWIADTFRLTPLGHRALYLALTSGCWPYPDASTAGQDARRELEATGAFVVARDGGCPFAELVIIDEALHRAAAHCRLEVLVRHAGHSARLQPEDCAALFYRLRNGKWPWAVVEFDRCQRDGIRARLREAQFTKGGAPYLPGIRAAAEVLQAAEEVGP